MNQIFSRMVFFQLGLSLLGLGSLLLSIPGFSAELSQTDLVQFEESLHWKKGPIALKNGIAKLEVSSHFKYLSPEDAHRVLEFWGNKNIGGTLGMLFPANTSPTQRNTWGIVMTYEETGHVSDDDASHINYDQLLKEMQEAIADENQKRKQSGDHLVELVGWATEPRYDSKSHKLYWAKELNFFDETSSHTVLNYNIRILGRKGVLNLNAVASMDQLKLVENETPSILEMVQFTPGNQYDDYQPGVDKLATYGLAGLIAAGVGAKVAAKAGLLKVLIGFLIAAKKFVIIGVLAVGAFLRKIFSLKKPASENDTQT